MGPTGVVLTSQGPWLFRALANHLWGLESGKPGVNQTLIQPKLSRHRKTRSFASIS
jgi:hypothetical protein